MLYDLTFSTNATEKELLFDKNSLLSNFTVKTRKQAFDENWKPVWGVAEIKTTIMN
jgi:hypothetical protein